MPKKTIAQICAAHGITRDKLNAIRTKGINAWDDAALAAAIKRQRPRVSKQAEIKSPSGPATKTPPVDARPVAQTIEEIEDALKRATSFDEVKILKEKLAGLKIAVSVRAESRDLISVGEVRESITRVVSAARGEVLKLASDLPPRLEGLGAAQMQKIIHAEIIAILTRLSDESTDLYAES
jgi:hypothetical protein